MLPGGLEDLYREVILDHYRNPRNVGDLPRSSVRVNGLNPLCGDRVELFLIVENDTIVEVAFKGNGCAISQASASMMTESVKGKKLEEVEAMAASFREFMTRPDAHLNGNGSQDMEALEGVKKFPVRVKCATLSWNTLQEAMESFRAGKKEGTRVEKDS